MAYKLIFAFNTNLFTCISQASVLTEHPSTAVCDKRCATYVIFRLLQPVAICNKVTIISGTLPRRYCLPSNAMSMVGHIDWSWVHACWVSRFLSVVFRLNPISECIILGVILGSLSAQGCFDNNHSTENQGLRSARLCCGLYMWTLLSKFHFDVNRPIFNIIRMKLFFWMFLY